MNKYRRIANNVGIAVAAGFMVIGGLTVGEHVVRYAKRWQREGRVYISPATFFEHIPDSRLPGPPRRNELTFELTDNDADCMVGMDDPENERWCDIAGNFYTSEFVSLFSYVDPAGRPPKVRVRIEPFAETFRGRLEARGLKPNFAYQMKLRGDLARDREGFEAIGRAGRWRLPGDATNYTDKDYEAYERKEDVEAYILFDFVVTDARGDAIREFALDSTLHVLWNGYRQGGPDETSDLVVVAVDASAPETYARPKGGTVFEFLWAERERVRYSGAGQVIRLPPHKYRAELVLTEESFHSTDSDGGWWATAMSVPVEFEIARPVPGNNP